METRKVILRADAGPLIGMGHFIRTLSLGEILNGDFTCSFAIRNPTEFQKEAILDVCEELIELPDSNDHFDRFIDCLKGNEVVVLDNYFFDTEYQKRIISLGCKLVCIDDLHDKHYVSHLVINHAEGLKRELFSVESFTQLLLGFKHALIRKPFLEGKKADTEKEFDILIGIGGTDSFNITGRIIEAIQENSGSFRIAVLLGDAYTWRMENTSNVRVFKNINANGVVELMCRSTIGILPASTIAIEACAARMPFIAGYFVDNQIEIYEGIKLKQLAYCIGDFRQTKNTDLRDHVISFLQDSEFHKSIIQRQEKLMDRKSAERIRVIFKQLF